MKQRRFPRPWDIEEINKAAFVVRDNNGTALAYVYFEEEPGRRTTAGLLTRDEARREQRITRACPSCCAQISRRQMRLCKGDSLKGGTRRSLSGCL
jgi:hypothetical protein